MAPSRLRVMTHRPPSYIGMCPYYMGGGELCRERFELFEYDAYHPTIPCASRI